jgi:integrase
MPRAHLTDITIRALKANGARTTYWDSQLRGFGLRVGNNTKAWLVMRGKTRERTTIGHYPEMPLAIARQKAKELLTEKFVRATARLTFEEALIKFLALHCDPIYKPRSRREIERTLRRHFGHFGARKLDTISDRDIGDVLEQLLRTPSEANHAYKDIQTFFRWCARPPRRYVAQSPCAGMTKPAVTTPRKRVLTDAELVEVWRGAEDAGYPFGHIVRLLILTGQRKTEIGTLHSSHIDAYRRTMTFPETKNGTSHTIPYGKLAAAIVNDVPSEDGYLFPGRWDGEKTYNGWGKHKTELEQQLERVAPWTLHDLRRTFATKLAALKVPPHIVERLLNHKLGSLSNQAGDGLVSAIADVYNRHLYLDEMREAIDLWEKHLKRLTGKLKLAA